MDNAQRKAMFANIRNKTGKSLSSKDLVAYSVSERKKVPIEHPRLVQLKNKRYAIKGESPKGNVVMRII